MRVLMFTAHATEFWSNPAFAVKLAPIGLAGLNALAFHIGPYARVDDWDSGSSGAGTGQGRRRAVDRVVDRRDRLRPAAGVICKQTRRSRIVPFDHSTSTRRRRRWRAQARR
jgi:hypothetical protein